MLWVAVVKITNENGTFENTFSRNADTEEEVRLWLAEEAKTNGVKTYEILSVNVDF